MGAQIIAVERDVEGADGLGGIEGRIDPGQPLTQAAGQDGSAAWDAEQQKTFDPAVGLDDLVGYACEGPVHVGRGHHMRGLG